jgi:2-(1,2-epoxy-1,2-dihydrophenyl)acetyl-CoA isomerase
MNFDDFSSVERVIDDGLARVTLNVPDRGNPIDQTFCREFRELAVELSERDDVRAILLAAKGRFFSVGGDIKSLARDRSAIPTIVKSWTADLHSAVARFMRMSAPVVAAVQGDVAGGSVSLVAAADVVYAADTVKFSAAFPMIGFSADSGSTITLSQRMGFSRAKRFLLMSETINARAALESGLVDFVVPSDQLMAEAETTAKKFAAGAKLAYGGIKQTMVKARNHRGRVSARSWKNALLNLTEDSDSVTGDGTRSADADFALPEVNALLNFASIKESLAGYADEIRESLRLAKGFRRPTRKRKTVVDYDADSHSDHVSIPCGNDGRRHSASDFRCARTINERLFKCSHQRD